MNGPAILFLHAFGASGGSWTEVAAALPGRRCVTPDLRGFGGAPPPGPGWETADWVEEAAALAAPLGRFVLVGHSMGGKLATLLAARRPPGLERLVLVAPSPPVEEPIPDRAAMLAGWGRRDAAETTARQISLRATHEPAVLEALVADSLRTSHGAWSWWVERGSRADATAEAARIGVPILVVAGAEDTTIPADYLAREAVPHLPGATLTVLPDSRHMVPRDAPAALARLVAQADA